MTVELNHPADTDFDRTAISETVELLGGRAVLKRPIFSKLDAHEVIVKGLPSKALRHIADSVTVLGHAEVLAAVGVSLRTVQRQSKSPKKMLSLEQSSRTWKFAEVLAKATEVMGSQVRAEEWLTTPATALDQRRPIDLLSSPVGAEAVEQLLGRLEYGVYT